MTRISLACCFCLGVNATGQGLLNPKEQQKETPLQEAEDGDAVLRQAAALPHRETAPSLLQY